jgi:hypothetical protein
MTYEDDEFIHIPSTYLREKLPRQGSLILLYGLEVSSSNEKVSNTPNGLYLERLFDRNECAHVLTPSSTEWRKSSVTGTSIYPFAAVAGAKEAARFTITTQPASSGQIGLALEKYDADASATAQKRFARF